MIWFYLVFVLIGIVGLFVVFLEWRQGVRHGLLGPLSTFGVMLIVSSLGVFWLHAMDGPSVHPAEHPATTDRTIPQAPPPITSSEGNPALPAPLTCDDCPSVSWRGFGILEILLSVGGSTLGGLLVLGLQGIYKFLR